LVGEDAGSLGFGQDGGEFAQRLAHQPCLHAHRRHAHLALQFRLRHQGRHGVHDDHIQCVGAGQRLADGQRFFATVRLRYQQVIQVDSQSLGIGRIQRVLGVNECRQSAPFLGISDHVQHKGRFARRLGAKDFHHAPARYAAHAQRQVQRQGAGGDDLDSPERSRVTQAHDAPVTIGSGNGGNGGIQIALARGGCLGSFGRPGIGGHKFFSSFGRHICVYVIVNLTDNRWLYWDIPRE